MEKITQENGLWIYTAMKEQWPDASITRSDRMVQATIQGRVNGAAVQRVVFADKREVKHHEIYRSGTGITVKFT